MNEVTCYLCDSQIPAEEAIQIGKVLVCPHCLGELDEALDQVSKRIRLCAPELLKAG